MPTLHKVEQGEYLSQIALKYGFARPQTIWNDPHNGPLKKKRKSPHILLPGDMLYIPDKADKQQSAATTNRHTYEMQGNAVKLRVALKDWDGTPLSNLACVLKAGGQIFPLTTDGDGKIEKDIPMSAQEAMLIVSEYGQEITLKIGHLDPHDEDTGWQARLRNLGYVLDGEDSEDKNVESAVEEFQCNSKLQVDGKRGPQTLTNLEKTHGC